MLNALSLPHAIPLKAPWIVSTSDREYIVCPPLRVLSVLSKFFGSKGDLKDFFEITIAIDLHAYVYMSVYLEGHCV